MRATASATTRGRLLRRQEQLVGLLCALGLRAVRPQKRAVINGGGASGRGRPVPRMCRPFPTPLPAPDRDDYKIRAFRDDVLKHTGRPAAGRCPQPRRVQRRAAAHARLSAGRRAARRPHPRRRDVPGPRRANPEDGRSSRRASWRALRREGPHPATDIIAYCRIGERSSHTWFVLKYLLGYPKVRNYDGSWTEWGNMVGVPIEK